MTRVAIAIASNSAEGAKRDSKAKYVRFLHIAKGSFAELGALITVPATGHRRVDNRSAVHQRRRGIRWTALALVHPTAGAMIKAELGTQMYIPHRIGIPRKEPTQTMTI